MTNKTYKAHLAIFLIDGKKRSVVALRPGHLGHASIPVDITVDDRALFMVQAGHQTEVFEDLPAAISWAGSGGVHQTPGAITVLEQRSTLIGTPLFEPFDLYRVANPIKDGNGNDTC